MSAPQVTNAAPSSRAGCRVLQTLPIQKALRRIDNSKEIVRVQRHDLREALDEMIAGKPVSLAE
jgi:hypothetical protein